MCRGKDHGGRRCPSDTSEARRLRRHNATARAKYSDKVMKPQKPVPVQHKEPAPVHTVETVKANIQNFYEGLNDISDNKERLLETDRRLNRIGEGVEFLAETKYGAPKDEEIKEAIDAYQAETAAEVERLNQVYKDIYEAKNALAERLTEEVASREEFPIIRERHNAWKERAPELWEQYEQLNRDEMRTFEEYMNYKSKAPYRIGDKTAELLNKRNEAVKAALQEVGVQFADPDSVKVSEDSHKDAVRSLKTALQFYPQEWVDASNREMENSKVPLRVKRSKGRAHYSARKGQKKYTNYTRAYLENKPADWEPDPYDLHDLSYVKADENGKWVDPRSGVTHTIDVEPGKTTWVRLSYEHWGYDTPPKGRGWEKITVYKTRYNSETRTMERTGEMETRYRRLHTRRSLSSWETAAELTVSSEAGTVGSKDKGFRVALHEFAHRVEHAVPEVARLEQSFLLRRAGHLSGDSPEELSPIYNHTNKERGYKDNFPTHYMGKVYDGRYYEILSMGMETLFGGTNGSFVGHTNHKADPDYKRFMLGILAQTARNKT